MSGWDEVPDGGEQPEAGEYDDAKLKLDVGEWVFGEILEVSDSPWPCIKVRVDRGQAADHKAGSTVIVSREIVSFKQWVASGGNALLATPGNNLGVFCRDIRAVPRGTFFDYQYKVVVAEGSAAGTVGGAPGDPGAF